VPVRDQPPGRHPLLRRKPVIDLDVVIGTLADPPAVTASPGSQPAGAIPEDPSRCAHASQEEMIMIEGTLIAESLRVGTSLEGLNPTVRKVSRVRPGDSTVGQPQIWTLLDFEADEAAADELARIFADALDQPGWYVDFRSPAETFVMFPGRIFRYPRGDDARRAEVQAHGRQLAIPETQLDWPV
jgi:hypothetical protein